MESMPIIVSGDMDIGELVELPSDMPDIVLVGDIAIDIEPVELDIDICMAGCAKNGRNMMVLLAQDAAKQKCW